MNPHHALDALVVGYPASIRRNKVIVIINSTHSAFVDESGGHKEGKILLLSACIQTHSVWQKFSDEWYRVLHEHPRVEAFHMREARGKLGEFAGWKPIEVDRKIIALTEVIMQHRPHIASCWMSETDYNQTMRVGTPPDVKHAYFTAFCGIVVMVAQYQESLGITTPVDFIFDEHGDIGNEALLWYSAMKEAQTSDIQAIMGSTPIFRDDEAVLPLQAADLIAWHKRRGKEFRGFDPEAVASMRIDELPGLEMEVKREDMEDMVKKCSLIPGIEEALGEESHYKRLKRAYRKARGTR